MTYSVLAITDGASRVDLLSKNGGLRLSDWPPQPPTAKGGGVWQDGQLSDGRRLAIKKWANVTDTYTLLVGNATQDQVIRTTQDLRRLLEKAVEYWTTSWQGAPVWIEAQAGCETNVRYALIHDYQASGEGNPYATPFVGKKPAVGQFTLTLEHGPWLSQPPGTGECVETSSVQDAYSQAQWVTNTAMGGANNNLDIIETATGRMLAAGGDNKIWRTDDGGVTAWTGSAVLGGGGGEQAVALVMEGSTGYIFAATSAHIFESTDNGATWASISATGHTGVPFATGAPFWYCPRDGYLYLLDSVAKSILRSTDHGVNWASVTGAIAVIAMTMTPNGDLYCRTDHSTMAVYKSTNGTTWTHISTILYSSASYYLGYPGDGYFYATGQTVALGGTELVRSTDAINWVSCPTPQDHRQAMLLSSSGYLYMTGYVTGEVWVSLPGGLEWTKVYQAAAVWAYGLAECHALKKMFVSAAAEIASSGITLPSPGQEATCDNTVMIANKNNPAQLTRIFVFDSPAGWTVALPPAGYPYNLLPAVPAVGDIVYFGMEGAVGKVWTFDNLVFNIVAPILYVTTWTVIWEYSQGGGVWAALTVNDETTAFAQTGVGTVVWIPPAAWAPDAINGITALWVRARVSAAVGITSGPTQGVRNVYTANTNSLLVAGSDVLGDLPALSHLWAENHSDNASVAAWANRYVLGLRSANRGALFSSILNIADTQTPAGLTLAGTGITVAAANIQTATGRQYTHTGTGISTWTDQFTFTFSGTLAAAYYGRFRVFLRAQQSDKHVGDVRVRLKVVYGSGGLSQTGDYVVFASLLDWQLLDLGSFKFPPIYVKDADLGNQMQLVIQLWSNDTADVHLYDLVLIPTDEWSADLVDTTNLGTVSGVGLGYQFDIDSVSLPKVEKRALVRQAGSDTGLIKSIYTPITAGPAILQANANQRLYVLCARYASAVWYSEPWLLHSAKLQAVFRYLLMRGNR